jgi:hypothetical protein
MKHLDVVGVVMIHLKDGRFQTLLFEDHKEARQEAESMRKDARVANAWVELVPLHKKQRKAA